MSLKGTLETDSHSDPSQRPYVASSDSETNKSKQEQTKQNLLPSKSTENTLPQINFITAQENT